MGDLGRELGRIEISFCECECQGLDGSGAEAGAKTSFAAKQRGFLILNESITQVSIKTPRRNMLLKLG